MLFFVLSHVHRRQKLAFAGNLPEFENPDQAFNNDLWSFEMGYISQRGAYWRAEIRRRGYKPAYRTFDTKQHGAGKGNRVRAR